jgi:hypothetical protein
MMDCGAQLEFVLIAERGILEKQAILLCESIRRFAGRLSSSAVTVVSPRKDRRPSRATLAAIDRLGVQFLPLDIDSACPEYGPSFKVHTLSRVARRAGPPIIIQLDSDTLFVAEPILLPGIDAAAARPVDLKGMCTSGRDDAFDEYWCAACRCAGVDYEQIPIVRTTVDRVLVRASYNGGLFAARRASGIFERTADIFRSLTSSNLKLWGGPGFTVQSGSGMVSELGSALWGTSQAALSLAAVAGGHEVALLPDTYNFPLHLIDDIVTEVPTPLVHIHYHWLASSGEGEANAIMDKRLRLSADVVEWLRGRLPLAVDG